MFGFNVQEPNFISLKIKKTIIIQAKWIYLSKDKQVEYECVRLNIYVEICTIIMI